MGKVSMGINGSSKAVEEPRAHGHAEPNSRPITDAAVRDLTLPAGKSKMILNDAPNGPRDKAFVPGFGVRISSGGAKTFILRYRADGRDRLVRIGPYGAWSVIAARERAAELRRQVDSGADPAAERASAQEAPTLAEVFERFESEHGHKLRASTLHTYQMQYRNHIKSDLGKRKIAKIEHQDIEALHRKITKAGGAYMANRVVSLLSRLFNVAHRWGFVDENPCKGIERNQEPKRKRYLKPDEVRRLLAALPKLRHQQSAEAIKLLLLTGARRMEVLASRWEQFDMEAGTWTKPAATTKQKSDHIVPLASAARELLAEIRQRRDAQQTKMVSEATAKGATEDEIAAINRRFHWVFPAHGAEGHQTDLKNAWATVQDKAGLPDVRVHDLRHSFASFLASGGASLPVIGAMLGHSQPQTTARYAHLFDDVQRAAADKVGDLLATLGGAK